jgi:hypothetical protein
MPAPHPWQSHEIELIVAPCRLSRQAGGDFASNGPLSKSSTGFAFEALDGDDVVMDVSVPAEGPITINTFSREVPADLVEAAITVARNDRAGWR